MLGWLDGWPETDGFADGCDVGRADRLGKMEGSFEGILDEEGLIEECTDGDEDEVG